MKQFIVLCAMILLGTAIFHMIMSNSDDSVISTVKGLWQSELELNHRVP